MTAGRKQWMVLLRWMNVIERLTTKQQWLRWGRIDVILTATALVILSGVFISSAQAISVGDRVGVTYRGDGVKIRDNPGTVGTNVIGHRHSGMEGEVLSGPQYKDGYTWWKLKGWAHDNNNDSALIEGWSAEGSGGTAWLKEMPGKGYYPNVTSPYGAGVGYAYKVEVYEDVGSIGVAVREDASRSARELTRRGKGNVGYTRRVSVNTSEGLVFWYCLWDSDNIVGWTADSEYLYGVYLVKVGVVSVYQLKVEAKDTNGNTLSGVWIDISPSDIDGNPGGYQPAPFERFYPYRSAKVFLTAPQTVGSYSFVRWEKNGQQYSTDRSIGLYTDGNITLVAVYSAPSNNPPSKPQNISPTNGETVNTLTPTLRASSFSDPDGDSHAASQWRIRESGSSSYVWDSGEDSVNKTNVSVPSGKLLFNKTYYWQVRYKDSRGNWSDWSNETWFKTEQSIQPPSKPSNPSPADGATDQPTSLTLSWSSTGATSYDFYFGDTNPPPPKASNLSTNQYFVSNLQEGKTYYWKVVAKNQQGSTPGDVWRFTTKKTVTGRFRIGDRVCVTIDGHGLRVRSSRRTDINTNILETKPAGGEGEILDGPQPSEAGTQYTWWKIKWDNGTIGWSVEGVGSTYYLEALPGKGTYSRGVSHGNLTYRVRVYSDTSSAGGLMTRETPGGTGIKRQPVGAKGWTLDASPEKFNGMIWWLIKWDDGTIGWSADSQLNYGVYLVKEQEQSFSRIVNLSLNPGDTIDFGSVAVGQYKDISITISNSSSSTGILTGTISVSGQGFRLLGSGSFELYPESNNRTYRRIITVRFEPTATGTYTGTLTINHNATNHSSPISYSLRGSSSEDAKVVALKVSPTSLNFGSVELNTTSEVAVRIENLSTSNDTLTVSNLQVTGEGFQLASGQSTNFNLSPGQYRDIRVQFTPTQEKTYAGEFRFNHNATNVSSPFVVPLQGTGTIIRFLLTINVSPSGSGEVWVDGTKYTDKKQYPKGSSVRIEARANSGYKFSSWSGDASGTNNSLTITMDRDKSITANFLSISVNEVTLTLSASPSTGGKVRAKINGVWTDWETSIVQNLQINSKVEIEANPVSGFEFQRWSGDIPSSSSTRNPATIMMDRNRNVVAVLTSPLPSGTIKGVDVSEWTGEIPLEVWQKIKQDGWEFAIVQGWGGTPRGRAQNQYAKQQLQNARSAGMRTAIYIVIFFNEGSGQEQVNQGLNAIGDEKNYISFIALDIEKHEGWNTVSYDLRVQRIKEAISEVEANGFKPIIYTSYGHWKDMLNNTHLFQNYPLWEAYYDGRDDLNYDIDKNDKKVPFISFGGWTKRIGKQYLANQWLHGKKVDFNVFDSSVFSLSQPTSKPPTPVISQFSSKGGAFTSGLVTLKLSFEHALNWVKQKLGQMVTIITRLVNKDTNEEIPIEDKNVKVEKCVQVDLTSLQPGTYEVQCRVKDGAAIGDFSQKRQCTVLPSFKLRPPFPSGTYVFSGDPENNTPKNRNDFGKYGESKPWSGRHHTGVDITSVSDSDKVEVSYRGTSSKRIKVVAPADGKVLRIYGLTTIRDPQDIRNIPTDKKYDKETFLSKDPNIPLWNFKQNLPRWDTETGKITDKEAPRVSHRYSAGDNHGYGITVILEHTLADGTKLWTLYAHLRAVVEGLEEGQWVKEGDPIGLLGGSWYGDPYGVTDHLHFEIRKPVDAPEPNDGYYPLRHPYPYKHPDDSPFGGFEGWGYITVRGKVGDKWQSLKDDLNLKLVCKSLIEYYSFYDPKVYIGEPTKKAFVPKSRSPEEPNDDFNNAKEIGTGSIAAIIGTDGDVDFFKFTGKEDELISVWIRAEIDGSDLDSKLTLFNSDNNILAENDDNHDGNTVDSGIWHFRIPKAGTYYIKVESTNGKGSENHFYTLYLRKETTDDFSNDFDTAHLIAGSKTVQGTIGHYGDVDVFRFDGVEGEYLNLDVRARRDGSPLDAIVRLHYKGSEGIEEVAVWDDVNGYDPTVRRFRIPATGTYYIELKDFCGEGGEEFRYTLSVEIQPTPQFNMDTTPLETSVEASKEKLEQRKAQNVGGGFVDFSGVSEGSNKKRSRPLPNPCGGQRLIAYLSPAASGIISQAISQPTRMKMETPSAFEKPAKGLQTLGQPAVLPLPVVGSLPTRAARSRQGAPAPSPNHWRWIIVDPAVSTVEGSCSVTKVFIQCTDTILYFKVETTGRNFTPEDTALYIFLDTDLDASQGLFSNFSDDYLVILGEYADGLLRRNGDAYEYVSELAWQKAEENTIEIGVPLSVFGDLQEFGVYVELHDDQLNEVDRVPDESFIIVTPQPEWLRVEPLGGVADAGQEETITITIDGSAFAGNEQVNETFKIYSRDPYKSELQIPIKVTVQPPQVPFESAAGLFMLSLPISVDMGWHEILNIPEDQMKLAIYDSEQQRYRLYNELTPEERKPKPGIGVWIKFDSPVQATITGVLPKAREPFVINLKPGWQIIGVPWQVKWTNLKVRKGTEELPIQQAAERGWIYEVLWTWDNEMGDYQMVWAGVSGIGLLETLDILKGYWIFAFEECQLVIPPKAEATRGILPGRKRIAESGFVFGLAAGDLKTKRRVWLGFTNEATRRGRSGQGLEATLPPESPEPSGVRIFALNAEGKPLAASLRFGMPRKLEWDVIVKWEMGQGTRSVWGERKQSGTEEITLTWEGLGYLPKGMSAMLVDTVTGTRRYMRTQSAYTFRPQAGETERRFKVVLEQGGVGLLRITNLRATPVRGQGVIVQFALTKAAVTNVEVLTLTGRRVTVVEGGRSRAEGQNSVIWRGVDNEGRKLPVGIYLIRVHAQDEDGRQVQAVTRVMLW